MTFDSGVLVYPLKASASLFRDYASPQTNSKYLVRIVLQGRSMAKKRPNIDRNYIDPQVICLKSLECVYC